MRRITSACWASLARSRPRRGATMSNSLATTVVTPWKWSGPRASPSSRSVSGPVTRTSVAKPSGIDLLDGRGEQQIGALGLGQRGVASLVAWVGGEILAGAELGRVDEQRHDDHVGLRARPADQRQVALVERAHRRDQRDALSGRARGGERGAQVGDRADRAHGAGTGRPRSARGDAWRPRVRRIARGIRGRAPRRRRAGAGPWPRRRGRWGRSARRWSRGRPSSRRWPARAGRGGRGWRPWSRRGARRRPPG